jgi:hypothetical protein
MKLILCLLVSGVGFSGCIYAAGALALLCRREWKDGIQALALSMVPLGIYAVAWQFLPLENWLILPGASAAIFSAITFGVVLKNGA